VQKYQTHNSCRQTWVPRWFRDLLVAYITECNSFFGINHFHSVDRKLSFQFLKPARVYSFLSKRIAVWLGLKTQLKFSTLPSFGSYRLYTAQRKGRVPSAFSGIFKRFQGCGGSARPQRQVCWVGIAFLSRSGRN
jgi:hypothetical protein